MEDSRVSKITLLDELQKLFPASSKTTLRSWIKEGRVIVNGVPVRLASASIAAGQCVSLAPKERLLPKGIQVLYEDVHLIAIIKPEGLLSVATHFEREVTAHGILKEYLHPKKVFVIHRLDQETSGVLLFALSDQAYHGLKDLFKRHAIDREYTAVVEGRLASDEGSWQCYLYEDAEYRVHVTQDSKLGELAITHYSVIQRSSKYTLLKLKLETGKKNQIRVQCQQAGHPVIGDKKYGATRNPLHRLCLHAHLLAFQHPVTHQPLRFESPVPQSFFKLFGCTQTT